MTEHSSKADHLCVLVHGLWGNPGHLRQVARYVRERYDETKLHILVAERNSGSFTYDGIELGGERVCHEIEEEVAKLAEKGQTINKISIFGYSLGGLVARYAIGVLESHGFFEHVQPLNFTTFASPYLGVKSPKKSWLGYVFNVLGPRTLSMSGKQLFLVDNFRDTGRPLLAILADPKSTFVRGLKRFKRRALYANVMNDRTAPYFTTGLATTDPFSEPDKIQLNYTEGYDRVILDRRDPVRTNLQPQKLSVKDKTSRFVKSLPFYATLSVLVPVGIVVFLGNSVVQTYHSSQRIKLHESGKAGIDLTKYRPPFFDEIREAVDEVREAAEDVYENINNAQDQEYLTSDSEDATSIGATSAKGVKKEASHPHHTLALTDEQFAIIEALDNVGFHKNLVRFHNTTHSHAAIVVRVDADHYEEGYQVMRHWLDNEFILE